MIIHFSILGVIIFVSLLYNRKSLKNKLNNEKYVMPIMPWLIIFGYITFLAAMRTAMNDTTAYRIQFEMSEGTVGAALTALKELDIKYKFFDFTMNLFKCFISDDYHMWFLFLAAIQSICFIKVFRKNCYGIFIPCYFFFASSLYYNYFSMLRQWTAVAIAFYGFEYLKEKKWAKYFACCIVAFLFHPSAFVCIIFGILAQGTPWKRKQSLILLISSIGIVFLNPLLSTMETVAEGTAYDYAISTMNTNSGSSPVRILLSAVPVLFAFVYRKSIEKENNTAMNICVNMSVLNCLLTVVATVTSGLYVVRLATFLAPYNVILYSFILNKVLKGKNKQLITLLFIVMYFAFYWYQMSHQGAWGYRSDILGTF